MYTDRTRSRFAALRLGRVPLGVMLRALSLLVNSQINRPQGSEEAHPQAIDMSSDPFLFEGGEDTAAGGRRQAKEARSATTTTTRSRCCW